jgi:hypothetical protein
MMRFGRKVAPFVVALIVFVSFGCGKSPTSGLKELGFYAVISGKSQYVSFKEYPSGATKRPLPVADFPKVLVLKKGDYFLLYGDKPIDFMGTSVNVLFYTREGDTYRSAREAVALDSFFSQEPLDPVREEKVTKLTPKASAAEGLYFLHKYVGMNGDAYLAFRIKR